MDTWHKLLFEAEIEQLITEREGMKAENESRKRKDEALAFGEDSFQILCQKFANIEEAIRQCG